MMNRNISLYLATSLFLFSLNVNAEEYKTTGEMTTEERIKVSDSKGEYIECLDESAITRLQTQNDIRVVADHSMKDCAPVLEDLYDYLTAANYAPDATKGFLRSISNRAVNKLLSNLMMFAAARPK
ncbi:MAG TPA: hypothetical protein EYQ42_01660 [Thiotrichaceae bacterium]|jgi:hypothetical protein|nr:hypothetical protein [Thiotrichaceae bacterium]